MRRDATAVNVIPVMAGTVRRDYCGCYGNDWVRTPHPDGRHGSQPSRGTS